MIHCLHVLFNSPVGLKEAALDSPTFRATTLHFSDQIEFLERWLDGYSKAASKLTSELAALENAVGAFLSYSTNPLAVSEAVLDHDYTLLSMRRSGDSSRDLWNGLVTTTRKMEALVAEPIKAFIQEDLRSFKVRISGSILTVRVTGVLLPSRKPGAFSTRRKNSTITSKPDIRPNPSRKNARLSAKTPSNSTKPAERI